MMTAMERLSVVVPTLDAARSLPATLEAVRTARAVAVVELLVVDGGSRDATRRLALAHGARLLSSAPGRGRQLAAGGAAATGDWLLFLHADTRLQAGWDVAAAAFMAAAANRRRAACFRLRFDDDSPAAGRVAWFAARRCRWLGLPYGDQGLLLARDFYRALGGFRALPLMEDVEFVRRIGRRRLAMLECDAVTSAERYRRSGYGPRVLRNLLCLAGYFLGVPPRLLLRLYG